jgi:hypothetical protein
MKLRRLFRWILGVIGFFGLVIEGIGYYLNRILALKYFPDQDWHRMSLPEMLLALGALYLVLVAASGRWKLWPGN